METKGLRETVASGEWGVGKRATQVNSSAAKAGLQREVAMSELMLRPPTSQTVDWRSDAGILVRRGAYPPMFLGKCAQVEERKGVGESLLVEK